MPPAGRWEASNKGNMNLNSSIGAICGELSEKQDCLDWLHERTGQNRYVVTTEEGYAFEIVHYLDTDFDYQNGLPLFNVSLFHTVGDEEIEDEQIKTAVRSFAHNLSVAINRLYRKECGQV